jgi:predicted nucleotidyltransferase
MQQCLPPLIQRTLQRLIRAFAPERIVLFGSYAKGTAYDGSDVDLLVIANLVGNPLLHQRRARQLAADCFPRIDVVFASPQDVSSAETVRSPFLLSILGRGITLYTRQAVLDSPEKSLETMSTIQTLKGPNAV